MSSCSVPINVELPTRYDTLGLLENAVADSPLQVHFIFKHKNPKTGEYEEKHLKSAPVAKISKGSTNLYTLIVKEDNTFEIKINGESSKTGSLLEDFSPSVNPEREIDDPEDTKPEDWVDEARIPDPEATKPEDWDEDAPFEIIDEEATKPDDWLEDEPTMVPDPEAQKPEDWDDEEDGDWIPPTVPNPKCEEVSGCGKWEPPTKKNPEYKGKWTPDFIDNPSYKGVWAPKKIANPDFFEDKTPAYFEPMGGVSTLSSQRSRAPLLTRLRLALKSGRCKATFCSTTSTLATPSRMPRNLKPKPTTSSTPSRPRKKRPASPHQRKYQNLHWISASWTTQSTISARRLTYSGASLRKTQSKPFKHYLKSLEALVPLLLLYSP